MDVEVDELENNQILYKIRAPNAVYVKQFPTIGSTDWLRRSRVQGAYVLPRSRPSPGRKGRPSRGRLLVLRGGVRVSEVAPSVGRLRTENRSIRGPRPRIPSTATGKGKPVAPGGRPPPRGAHPDAAKDDPHVQSASSSAGASSRRSQLRTLHGSRLRCRPMMRRSSNAPCVPWSCLVPSRGN